MKRLFSVLLIISIVLPVALADEEEEHKSVFDSVGAWFGQAWEDSSGWVSNAVSDVSKWVEQAWTDSSQWVVGIWGDASTWAMDTYESASSSVNAWWGETFNTVTETADNQWNWLIEEAPQFQSQELETLSNIKDAVMDSSIDAEKKVKTAFFAMLKKLKLNDEDSQKVWDTIDAYADQKEISKLAASKLALPYLFQLTVDSASSQDSIPAVAIAQYLTAVIEKLNVCSTDVADELIGQMNEALSGF